MKKSNEVVREHVDDVHEKKGSVSFAGERVLITPSFSFNNTRPNQGRHKAVMIIVLRKDSWEYILSVIRREFVDNPR